VAEQRTEKSIGPGGLGDSLRHAPEAAVSEWLHYARASATGNSWKSAIVVVRLENHIALEEALPTNCIRLVMEEVRRRVREVVPTDCEVIHWTAREVAFFARGGISMKRVHRLAIALRGDLDRALSMFGLTAIAVTTIGAVQIDRTTTGPATVILDRMNQALSRAARLREGRFAVYDHRHVESARYRLETQSALRNALHNEGLTLAYQPIRDLSTGKIVALEALARWKDPHLGDVSPSTFVAAAEEAGLIGALEKWVVRTACRQLSHWRRLGFFDLLMSVNVSATQFTSREFGLEEPMLRALAENDLPPAALQVEITEAAVGDDAERTMLRSLQRLSHLGTRFVIDDFGTGYSSLSRIHRLPVHGIKIDRSFVLGLAQRDSSRKVVSAVIALARELDLEVIAEGVERNVHRRALVEIGCRLGQGYLLGRPLPPEDIPALLTSKSSENNSRDQQRQKSNEKGESRVHRTYMGQ
jgi:EAL domain-containing protein (putative c-di-GMP-specific phosphodiesterase class I)